MDATPLDPTLRQLVEKLQKAHGSDLVAVILYGSGAEPGEHDADFSDVNVLCVLTEITALQLERSAPVLGWWRAHEKPAPLLLSRAEVAASTDCFPIEFHDLQRRRKVLFGADVIEGLEISDAFYRAQVEYELRSKLLRLRQKAMAVWGDRALTRRLLAESVTTFCVLFRHALRLHGTDVAPQRWAVIEAAQRQFGIRPDAFRKLFDLREKKLRSSEVDPSALLGDYLQQIGIVIDAVDQLPVAGLPDGTTTRGDL